MAAQRLNNDIRDAFINAVMADVPTIDYAEKIRDAVNKAAKAALPAGIKKVLADEALAKFVNKAHCTLNRHDGLPDGEYLSFNLHAESSEALNALAVATAADMAKQWAEQSEKHRELRAKLRSVAYHCTTRKQLAEAFPEFERYLPPDEQSATRNLPALANVVTDFVRAGWPKKARAAA